MSKQQDRSLQRSFISYRHRVRMCVNMHSDTCNLLNSGIVLLSWAKCDLSEQSWPWIALLAVETAAKYSGTVTSYKTAFSCNLQSDSFGLCKQVFNVIDQRFLITSIFLLQMFPWTRDKMLRIRRSKVPVKSLFLKLPVIIWKIFSISVGHVWTCTDKYMSVNCIFSCWNSDATTK